jgi:hypothetical protein
MSDVDIESALREEFERTCRDARVPSASAVFWRASIRARSDAARAVDRPMTIVTAVAGAAIAGAGAAIAGTAWRAIPNVPHLSVSAALALGGVAVGIIAPLALAMLGSRTRSDRPRGSRQAESHP